MRPTHRLPSGHEMRELTMWKAIVLGIVTFGIYFLVLVYQNTKDIQEARREPFAAWQAIFWVGIVLGPLQVINYVFNGIGLKEMRSGTGQDESPLWIVAVVLSVVVPPVGQILWAVHFNDTVRTAATSSGAAAPPAQAPPIQQAA